ncbi:MAG: threonine synthase, partial [Gammaproteobacteria bacterium]|nr:threonine synthase [Gammaproteobacteria bacterium]
IIRATIKDEFSRNGIAWCPHTATGLHVYRELPESEKADKHWVAVATAHAAKFDTIVEPLLGISTEPPSELAAILDWPAKFDTIDASLEEVSQFL